MAEAAITFHILERLTTIVSQQREGLRYLHDVFSRLFNACGPLPSEDSDAVDLDTLVLSDDGLYSLQFSDITSILKDLGMFIPDRIE